MKKTEKCSLEKKVAVKNNENPSKSNHENKNYTFGSYIGDFRFKNKKIHTRGKKSKNVAVKNFKRGQNSGLEAKILHMKKVAQSAIIGFHGEKIAHCINYKVIGLSTHSRKLKCSTQDLMAYKNFIPP